MIYSQRVDYSKQKLTSSLSTPKMKNKEAYLLYTIFKSLYSKNEHCMIKNILWSKKDYTMFDSYKKFKLTWPSKNRKYIFYLAASKTNRAIGFITIEKVLKTNKNKREGARKVVSKFSTWGLYKLNTYLFVRFLHKEVSFKPALRFLLV